jgi:glycerol-3-phosphate dehydrogenase
MFDILIIGAGIVGSLLARELRRYTLSVAILDKENDVGNVTSMANSAIIHSGYDPLPGTLKAKMNILGNKMFDKLTEELDVSFGRVGSLTVAIYDEQLPMLEELAKRAKQNGVEVKLLSKDEVLKMEPNITKEVKGALFAPTAGIIDPFNLCVHAMENALDNGAKLFLGEKVTAIANKKDYFIVKTSKGNEYEAKMVINATGLYSDKIAELVAPIDWKITPRKGQYFVLDHYKSGLVKHVIFPLPSEKGKGILVTMTTSGNYLVGPSSELTDNREDFSCDIATLRKIKDSALLMVPDIPFHQTIRSFAGLRASSSRHDFIIETPSGIPNFVNVGGIESPGFVSAPAIAKYIRENFVSKIFDLKENKDFNPRVRKYINPKRLRHAEKIGLIKENPDYGEIVCNCEKVTLGEVRDVLSRNCPPHTIKAMKKRVRAGFGKCQGGFCQPLIVKELSNHYKISPLEVLYDKDDSEVLLEELKENK